MLLILRAESRSSYLNLFSETNCKKTKNILLPFYHSLALHTGLEKTRTSTLLDWGWLYGILDMDLKNTQTALRDSVDSLLY